MLVYERLGGEITVNTTYGRTQAQSEVTTLADGRFLVTWVDADFTVFSNRYLRAQIFEADGTAVGAEMTLTGPVDRLDEPSVAALEGGGFVTVWRDLWTLQVQCYDADGAPAGTAIAVSTSEANGAAEVTATVGGGFAIAWIDEDSPNSIHLQTFDASGVAISGNVTVNGSTVEDAPTYVGLSVAALAGGNVVVTWFDTNGSTGDDNVFMARVFTAAGVPLGAQFAVNLNPATANVMYGEAPVVALANGNFAVSWTELDDSLGIVNQIQIFTDAGVRVGAPIVTQLPVASVSLSRAFVTPALAELADGSIAVVHASTTGYLTVEVYGADGSAITGPIQVETQTGGLQSDPSIAALEDGGFVVTWTDYNGAGADDDQVKAQRFGPLDIEPVTITSDGGGDSAALAVAENGLATTMVAAAGGFGPLGYSIVGGADAARFAIDATSGALSFVAAPDFETPADADNDNVYEVVVRASDGWRSDTQALSVTVGNVNEAPVIAGVGTSVSLARLENSVLVQDFDATDGEGNAVSFALSGADAAKFTIDSETGVLQFVTAPNYEVPGSAAGTNSYSVTVSASDGVSSDAVAVTVVVGNVNDAPAITSLGGGETAARSVSENTTTVATITAVDEDLTAPFYTIVGGADAARFTINLATGSLRFAAAPNFEAPGDADGNNVYEVIVSAGDGTLNDTQTIEVTVTDVPAAITSFFGGATGSLTLNENTTAVTTITSTEFNPASLAYSIVGGVDAARFAINATTGALTFVAPPNYEAPGDASSDNLYLVIVGASDGTSSDSQSIYVTIQNVAETPVITSNGGGSFATVTVNEGIAAVTTVVAVDSDLTSPSYSISGGSDSARFAINSATGVLTFLAAPDFEAPGDANGDNIYSVVVRASDGFFSDTQTISVTVADVNVAPVITSNGGGESAAISVNENSSAVTTVVASDVDGGVTYSLAGGADAARFTIDAGTGALSFVSAPDFEAPADAGGDNVYDVIVSASDGSFTDSQAISVTVAGVNEAPAIVSNGGGASAALAVSDGTSAVTTVVGADFDGDALTYAIAGGADAALFAIDAQTGALSFLAAPDFDAPADAGADNVYEVTVSAGDGGLSDTQALSIVVQGVPLEFETTQFVQWENYPDVLALTMLNAGAGEPIAFAVTGGADAALFQLSEEGLIWLSPRDYEAPADADGDNVYEIEVTAQQGGRFGTATLSFTLNDVNEAPSFVSAAEWSHDENEQFVGVLEVSDPEDGDIRFFVAGGADGHLFQVLEETGEFGFLQAPDFELPADADGDNVYEIEVGVVDSDDYPANVVTTTIHVTVGDVSEDPAFAETAFVASENGVFAAGLSIVNSQAPAAYTITGGIDAALFELDGATGELRFLSAPDFEVWTDYDGDNVFEVEVTAAAGSSSIVETIFVTVTNVDEAPVFSGPDSFAIPENGTTVATILTWDPEEQPVSYSIGGGVDAARFSINATTGALRFISAPNFEAPTDSGANNVYNLTVVASDGALSSSRALSVTVTNANETPVITSNGGGSSAALSISENTTTVLTVVASDPEGGVAYALAGGADAALFSINASTGVLRFITAPDYEAWGDSGANNVYNVTVRASDAGGLSDTQALSITVTNVNEAPIITTGGGGPSASYTVNENTTVVTSIFALDESSVTYSIVSGQDSARFTISPSSGQLRFLTAPNYESPTDGGANNVYNVTVRAADGSGLSDTQMLAITVANVNEAPVIISNGGGTSAALTVSENATAVTTLTATDQDGGARTYAISGGADAALFAIDASTGVLTYLTAPDFEVPGDADGNNVYDVVVRASDSGGLSDTQTLAITVANVNEAPVIGSNGSGASAALGLDENSITVTIVAAADPEDGVTYALAGGADAARFAIDASTGVLSFIALPDFESPEDADGDNAYEVVVSASDGELSDTQALSVMVYNINEAPVITSSASVSVSENGTEVTTVDATDPEGGVTFALAGGADAALFAIDASTGALSFIAAPDHEAPDDADADNVYDVVVSASDGSLSDTQALSVTVDNADEAPTIVSNGGGDSTALAIDENAAVVTTVAATDPEGVVAYALAGGADVALFAIDAGTGALTFVAAPDFEAPADADGDNVYEVLVSASDGSLVDTQALAVAVANLNDNAPVITPFQSDSIVSAMAENNVSYFDFGSTDADGDSVVFSLSGQDAASFTVNAATGLVQFLAAPDFEAPGSALGTNSYLFDLIASDGSFTDVLHVTLHVSNSNEPLSIISDGGGAEAAIVVAEHAAAVTTVVASDLDLTAPSYAIAGGADAAHFAIDPVTGALAFVAPADFEAPGDADGDNVYQVTVSASDGTFTDTQALSVTLADANDAPAIASDGGGASAALALGEGVTAVTTVVASDPDGDSPLAYAIAGGADAVRFAIDAATGTLSFLTAPDFEAPADADGDNVYQVVVSASDGSLDDTQAFSVTVTNVNEAPVIDSNGGGSSAALVVEENSALLTSVAASDPDGGVTYALAGGADAARFVIEIATGALSFVAAPDYDVPGDADADNVYEVLVSASDGSLVDTQALSVTVGNVNEAPTIVSNGGGTAAAIELDEDTLAVTAVLGVDVDAGAALTYAITGGTDAALFAIDASSGALGFAAAPDFEAPADQAGDNIYSVVVTVSDGELSASQAISVLIRNINEGLSITSPAAISALENATAVAVVTASDLDGDTVAYSIAGGADAALFAIDAQTGALSFVQTPNFETPADADGDNAYAVVVEASDGTLAASQALTVTIDNVNEAPVITSGGGGASAAYAISENATTVATIAASDPEGAVTYALAGGADAAQFAIDSVSGALRFIVAPDHDAPTDANADNVYEVIVSVGDGSLADTQAVTIAVSNLVDGLTLTGNSSANTLNGSYEEDTINGLSGNDTLNGLAGADTIDGGNGRDLIAGGAGGDLLTGGLNSDTFAYGALGDSTLAASDRLLDFSRSQGDRINLSAIDANAVLGGNQSFSFIGGSAFSNVAGQLRYFEQSGNTFVQGDVDGDGLADFQVVLDTLVSPAASDFIL